MWNIYNPHGRNPRFTCVGYAWTCFHLKSTYYIIFIFWLSDFRILFLYFVCWIFSKIFNKIVFEQQWATKMKIEVQKSHSSFFFFFLKELRLYTPSGSRETMKNFIMHVTTIKQTHKLKVSNSEYQTQNLQYFILFYWRARSAPLLWQL